MYITQIILLLFAMRSLSAYTVVQVELKNVTEAGEVRQLSNKTVQIVGPELELEPALRHIIFVMDKRKDGTTKKKTEESPIQLEGSLRPFTNGHGYQFVDWGLIDEHQSRAGDKAQDKSDSDTDSEDDADDHDDTGDEKDKHDDHHEVTENIPLIDPRHPTVEKLKKLRNKMFDETKEKYQSIMRKYNIVPIEKVLPKRQSLNSQDKKLRNKNIFDEIKEKYQSIKRNNVEPIEKVRRKRQLNSQTVPGAQAQHHSHPVDVPDHMNRVLVNRPPLDNSKKFTSPVLRDENGNILCDTHNNMNSVFSSGRQFGGTPKAYWMCMNNDQGHPFNHINHIQNEPIIYNNYISQPVQYMPLECHTLNNNPFNQIKRSNTPDVKKIPTSDINRIDIHKSNQTPNYEAFSSKENENVTQLIDTEKARNNHEANITFRQNVEMINSISNINKKFSTIKEKVKANINGLINTPEGRKLLSHGFTVAGERLNNVTVQNVNDFIPPSFKNLTANNVQTNCIDEGDGANCSFIEFVDTDKKINADMRKFVENTVNSDTQNSNEVTTNQTLVENKYEILEPPVKEVVTTTLNETKSIEKVKESTLDPVTTERLNETSTTYIKENTCTELIEETKTDTSIANGTNEISLVPVAVETFNRTSTTETKENTCKELIEETKEDTTVANDSNVICLVPVTIESFNDTSTIEKKDETNIELVEETKTNTSVANDTNEIALVPVTIESFNDTSTIETKDETNIELVEETKTNNSVANDTNEIALVPITIESFKGISTTEIKEETCTKLVEETKTNTSVANDTNYISLVPLTIESFKGISTTEIKKKICSELTEETKIDSVANVTNEITLVPVTIEIFNKTPTTEIKEETCTELIEETKTDTSVANDTNEISLVPVAVETLNRTSTTETKENTCKELIEETKKDTTVANDSNVICLVPVTIESFNDTSTIETKDETNIELVEETKTNTSVANDTNEIALVPVTIESLNETSSTEVKMETCTELKKETCAELNETKTETSILDETNENCNNKKKYYAVDNKDEKKSENLNLDDLFNKVEFWGWLSKWTTDYMKILNENVEIIVKTEVAKKLEEIYSKMEKEEANS